MIERTQPCVSCQQPTDTRLDFFGDDDWHTAALIVLGLPDDEAEAVVQYPWGMNPAGRYRRGVHVCVRCVRRTPFPAPVLNLPGNTVPIIEQPDEATP